MSAKIEKLEDCTIATWECDDEVDGFEFKVTFAKDGDLHLSIWPKRTNPNAEHFLPCCSASLRIRMPVIGGGKHEHLYDSIVGCINKEIFGNPIVYFSNGGKVTYGDKPSDFEG